MNGPRRLLALVLACGAVAALSGCSLDGVLWGPEGAGVISTTEKLIAAAPSGEQGSLTCEDAAADFGDAEVWEGLSAGEPEQFDAADSVDRPGLDATWRINLEGAGIAATSVEGVPTDVFYRETDSGWCVADVVWQTVDVG